MSTRFSATFIAAVFVVAAFAASGASAGAPTIERIEVDGTVPDPDLSIICGFPVAIRAEGHLIVRTFDQEGTGVVEVNTYSLWVAAVANGNAFPFPAHGGNTIRITPDTEVIAMTFGMTSGFTGVLKFNRTTGESILEPQRTFGADLDELCAALAA